MAQKCQGHLDCNILDGVFIRAKNARLSQTSVILAVIKSIPLGKIKNNKKGKARQTKARLSSGSRKKKSNDVSTNDEENNRKIIINFCDYYYF